MPPRVVWWRVALGEVYIVEGYDPDSASKDADGKTVYSRYILCMGSVRVVVPVDAISLVPPGNADYDKASKIYAQDAAQAEVIRQAILSRMAEDQRAAAQAEYLREIARNLPGIGN